MDLLEKSSTRSDIRHVLYGLHECMPRLLQKVVAQDVGRLHVSVTER